MSHAKDPTPLFEIIHKAPRGAPRAVRVPEWMRHADEMEKQVEAAPPTAPGSASSQPAWSAWWNRPVRFRLRMGVLTISAAAVALALIVAFLIGKKYEERQAYQESTKWSEVGKTLEGARQLPVNPGLIPSSVPRNLPPDTPPPPGTAGAAGSATDPREPGLNYFRLVTLPQSAADDGRRAVAFLQSQGVDAALLPDNNGRSVKLMVLPGFSKVSSPEARKLEDRLKSLGRKWKSEHRGSADWNDLLAERYKPGVN